MRSHPQGIRPVKKILDLAYLPGGGPRNQGDLFLPRVQKPDRIVMLIHGGGWQALSKESIHGIGQRVVEDTSAAVWLPNYRLIGDKPWPACLDDVEAAARWVLKATSIPLASPEQRRLVVGGFSAGGHLALMLGLGRMRNRVAGLISGAGPTLLRDGLPTHARDLFSPQFWTKFFGHEPQVEDWRLASPIRQLRHSKLPPLLLIHSIGDHLVPPFHSKALQKRYARHGGACRTCFFRGRGPSHDLVRGNGRGALADRQPNPDVRKAIRSFLADELC